MPAPEALHVQDDERDFYGRDYWFTHQNVELGYPDLRERARLDLPERCLHWLRTLLAAKLPPARVLELGCAHGGFVALMRWAGFDATGLELSPFVVRFAQETFQVPVLLGPLEWQHLPAGSMDAVIMNDVLEHLPDPEGTLQRCADLLQEDGVLIIQTPSYKGEASAEDLIARHDQFLDHLNLAKGHLFLFSQSSVRRILGTVGFSSIRFERPFFDYDQFLVAGRNLNDPMPDGAADEILGASPSSRLVRALLDKNREADALSARLRICEEDRAARLSVIEKQGADLARVPGLLAERDDLADRLAVSEADRAERLAVIEKQGAEVAQIPGLLAERDDLANRLAASEADRAARLAVIEAQGAQIGDLSSRLHSLEKRIADLSSALRDVRPQARLGIALWGEVRRIRRIVGEVLAKDQAGGENS